MITPKAAALQDYDGDKYPVAGDNRSNGLAQAKFTYTEVLPQSNSSGDEKSSEKSHEKTSQVPIPSSVWSYGGGSACPGIHKEKVQVLGSANCLNGLIC